MLENNGIESSVKRTRHINIGYLFITDIINKGGLRVKYCPTEEMKSDFLRNHYKENYLKIQRLANQHSRYWYSSNIVPRGPQEFVE